MTDVPDVAIAGGGVIGLAIAWRAAAAGLRVVLADPGRGDAAALVAAGMLAPSSEALFGEQQLLALNLLAVGRIRQFSAELESVAPAGIGLRREGTLAVAYDQGDRDALARLTTFRKEAGLHAQELDHPELRELEPFLAPDVRSGVLFRGDYSVDNRAYTTALRAAGLAAGVRFVTGTVTEVAQDRLVLADGAELAARTVVVATGAWTSEIKGLPEQVRTAVRPVKGQVVRLMTPAGMPRVLSHSVRATVRGAEVYLVPRASGEIVVGSTQEERGPDRSVTAGAVHDLLRDAMTVLPVLSELVLAETCAGLRPGTPDNGPIVGALGPDGPILATGHFRNGILMSAVTADAVVALLTGGEPAAQWAPFSPGRLAGQS